MIIYILNNNKNKSLDNLLKRKIFFRENRLFSTNYEVEK